MPSHPRWRAWLQRPGVRLLCRIVFVGAVIVAYSAAARAHPIHLSAAEADYNPATHQLEVALKVFADDFEQKLSARVGHRVSLEKTPPAEFDALALAYLRETFTVRTAAGAGVPLVWAGREAEEAENRLWLYFTVPLPDGIDGIRLAHLVLAEEFRDQLNTVRIRDRRRETTLLFYPDRTEKTIRLR